MILLITLVICGLFAWTQFGNLASFGPQLSIPTIPGILAICTFVIVLVSYFVAPLQQLRSSAYLNYLLVTMTIFMLVVETGGSQSVYLSMFIATLPFASLLGIGGGITGVAIFAAFIVHQYLIVGLSQAQTVELAVMGGATVMAGFILWGRSDTITTETVEDRSYHELASQLSQMAGKSEVVINAIGDGVLALNAQGVIQLINPAAERLIGWQSHDALNLDYKSVLKLLNTKNQPVEDINNPVMQALNMNKPTKTDNFSIETHSGKSFLASISVSPVGQPGEGVIIVFRDVTAEKSDERQRVEFISTASHEMRTPVASIEGYLGLVLNPKITAIDEKARDYVTKAHASAQHLGRLFADLLDVSKADDSRLKNDPKVVDVVPFVHDIVEGLAPKAAEKSLLLLYKPLPDNDDRDRKVELAGRRLTPVYYANVDNDHLREVVQNLVENAIKYTLKGQVTVDVNGDDTHVVISIADTGIGIPREDQSHLFQKFYRVDNSDTREIGGTGLGLYLCRKLTETIGGRIWVESEYQQGSTFFVEIPRIGHDEATRLIEQASVEAEHEAQAQAQTQAMTAAPSTTTPAPAVPSIPVQPPEQVPPTPAAPIPIPVTMAPATPPAPQPSYKIPVTAFEQPTAAPQAPIVPQPGILPPNSIPTPPTVATVTPVATEPQQVAAGPGAQFGPNTPLSTIETNPGRYISSKRAHTYQFTVPPREQ